MDANVAVERLLLVVALGRNHNVISLTSCFNPHGICRSCLNDFTLRLRCYGTVLEGFHSIKVTTSPLTEPPHVAFAEDGLDRYLICSGMCSGGLDPRRCKTLLCFIHNFVTCRTIVLHSEVSSCAPLTYRYGAPCRWVRHDDNSQVGIFLVRVEELAY